MHVPVCMFVCMGDGEGAFQVGVHACVGRQRMAYMLRWSFCDPTNNCIDQKEAVSFNFQASCIL